MKNLKQFCVTLLLACACIQPAWATQYCSTPVNPGGHAMNVTCEHIGANYIMKFELTGSETFYSLNTTYGGIDGSGSYDYKNYGVLSEENKVATFTFPGEPTGLNGSSCLFLIGGMSGYVYYAPTSIEWGTCAPKTMYFVNSWGWETPYVYLYKNGSSEKNAEWPGQTLATAGATQISTTCTGAPVYQIEYDSKYDRVIFNNGSGNQTSDLVICENRFYNPHPNGQYDADEWYYSNNFSLVGTFNGWNAATNPFSAWTSGSTVVSTTVHLGAGSYEFKIRQRDRSGDYGNNGTITGDVNCWFMSPNEGNCHLTTTIESDYTFTYDFAANRLSVAFPETVPPCMSSVSEYSTGSNSAVLNVSATDGDRPTPTTFRVSTSSSFASYADYAAVAGQITVTGLAPCTGYTLYVAAIDANGNISTDNETASCQYQSVTFTTTASTGNLAQGKTVTAGTAAEGDKANITDNNTATSWRCDNTSSNWYAYVDLEAKYYVNRVRIYYNDNGARPTNYALYGSNDASNWYILGEYSTIPTLNAWTTYDLDATAARYVKIQASAVNNVYGFRIAEMEVYGNGECYEEMDPPTMVSASFVSATANSATIAVSGTDAKGQAIRLFSDGTNTYTATEGRITITDLLSCNPYNITLYAIDKNGTSSSGNATVANRSKSVSFTTGAPSGINMAEDAATTAIRSAGAFPLVNLTDGRKDTRWSSGDISQETGHDWAQVDLGVVQLVDNVRIYWETACASDYEVLFSRDGINYFSVYHQTSVPTSTGTAPTLVSQAQDHRLTCPFATRYIKIQANHHNTGYGLSIWELEVYGPGLCAGLSSIPEMDCAQLLSVGSFEADIAVAASDAETVEANMKYEVLLTSGEAGYKQLTAVYNFQPADFTNSEIGHLTLGGLMPDVPYEAHIYAIDEASNKSTGYQIINFRTDPANGCTWSDTERGVCDGSGTWTEGYTITIENNTPTSTKFRITATALDNFTGIVAPYFFSVSNFSNPCGNRTQDLRLSDVAGKARTYTADIDKSIMTSDVGFMLKFEYSANSIGTKVIPFDVTSECMPKFVIYHYDDAPTSTAVTSSEESSISEPILYYRHFTPDAFEDAAFPFAIDSVRIYDTDDHQYYKLTAQYNDGTTRAGNFYLREFPDEGSNGESFTSSWEDGTHSLPQKNNAYSIRFPNTGGYYANKYILFHGHPGDIQTSLSLGDRPTTDDLYKVYPNPTMSAQDLDAKAYVTTDRSENLYWKEDDATVHAFETYVLANENTMKRMRRIAAWSEGDDTPTTIEDVRDAMAIHACIAVYSLTGQKIGEWHNCSFGDAEDAIALRGQKGCYILVSEGQTHKMIIQ